MRETKDELPHVVSGAIDLVYRAGDGWQIVDYKTDAGTGHAELQKRYAAQLEAYRESWMRTAGSEVVVRLVGIRP